MCCALEKGARRVTLIYGDRTLAIGSILTAVTAIRILSQHAKPNGRNMEEYPERSPAGVTAAILYEHCD